MSDPALSRPPFIPEGEFMCCLCFGGFKADQAWVDEKGQAWDVCLPCGQHDVMVIQLRELQARLDAAHAVIRKMGFYPVYPLNGDAQKAEWAEAVAPLIEKYKDEA